VLAHTDCSHFVSLGKRNRVSLFLWGDAQTLLMWVEFDGFLNSMAIGFQEMAMKAICGGCCMAFEFVLCLKILKKQI
jgi:hypothetical protein